MYAFELVELCETLQGTQGSDHGRRGSDRMLVIFEGVWGGFPVPKSYSARRFIEYVCSEHKHVRHFFSYMYSRVRMYTKDKQRLLTQVALLRCFGKVPPVRQQDA
jgi:hypothetical protein